MTQSTPETTTRLWTPEGFREDGWVHAEDVSALAGNNRVILPLHAFLDLDAEQRKSSAERLGVLLQPGDQLDAIVEFLDQLALVALAFPAFNDGRSFSKAELLRSRHGYDGAVRATGQVLIDQLPHMLRVGFNEFEVSHPVLLKRLEAGEVGGLSLYYQPSVRQESVPDKGAKYAWRRQANT